VSNGEVINFCIKGTNNFNFKPKLNLGEKIGGWKVSCFHRKKEKKY
jgi:hypothetical protein